MSLGIEKLSEKYNTTIDPATLLKELEISWDPDPKSSNVLLAHCPLHKGKDQSSLHIRKDKKTFSCTVSSCPGHKGGNLIQLYSLVRDVSLDDASLQIFNMLGLKTTDENRLLKRNLYISFSEKLITEDYIQAAKNMLLAGFEEFPDNLVIISRLINIFTREGDKPRICEFLIKASGIVAKNRNFSSAKAALKRVFTFDPDNEEAQKLLAEITVSEIADFYESALAPEGEDSFFESLKEISLTPSLRARITETLLKHQRYKMIERLYSDLPDDLDDEQKSHLEEVIDKLRMNIPQHENPVDYLVFLADILLRLGDFKSAKEQITEAKKALEEGQTHQRLEEVDARLKNFEKLLMEKDYEKARDLMRSGNYQEALDTLYKTASAGHLTPELLRSLIHCHFKLRQLSDAHDTCLKLADFHETSGEYSDAALSLFHALLFKPNHRDTVLKLKEIFNKLERNDIVEQLEELSQREVVVESRQIFHDKLDTPPPSPPSSPLLSKEIILEVDPVPEPVQKGGARISKKEYDFQLPISLKLFTTGTANDRMAPIQATTLTLGYSFIQANCGDIQIPGIQPASLNYILHDCQVMCTLVIPEQKEPVKIFGCISKVQNRRISKGFHRIVTIDIKESEESSLNIYRGFLDQLIKGKLWGSPEPNRSTASVERVGKSKIQKELLVSIRFLDEAGEEKCPDLFYANTMNLSGDHIILNFGEISIPGVPNHSQNFFLENSVYELTIPLPEHNHTVCLFGQAKKVKNKMISGKKNKVVEVEFSQSHERDRQIFQDYVRCFLSV